VDFCLCRTGVTFSRGGDGCDAVEAAGFGFEGAALQKHSAEGVGERGKNRDMLSQKGHNMDAMSYTAGVPATEDLGFRNISSSSASSSSCSTVTMAQIRQEEGKKEIGEDGSYDARIAGE
jgi:hypothetical protein